MLYLTTEKVRKSAVMLKPIKLTLLFCLTSLMTYAHISTKEKNALLAIYNATQGDYWTQTWDLEADVST